MKKYLLISFLCIIISGTASAQNAIARLKLEDAEIAYSKKEYFTTIKLLQEAEDILKASNPKLLHLKIMSMSAIVKTNSYKSDPEYVAQAIRDANFYLKNYENVPNNEDKYRDIYEALNSIKDFDKYSADLALAIKGDSDGQYRIGDYYRYLNVNRKDRSLYWLNKAISAGNDKAMMSVAEEHLLKKPAPDETKEESKKKNFPNALKYYEMAANKGNLEGMYWTSLLYNAIETPDLEKSRFWCDKAADLGYLQSASSSGDQYYRGFRGAVQSDGTALKYFTKAISLTPKTSLDTAALADSYFALSQMYFFGDHVNIDYKQAELFADQALGFSDKKSVVGPLVLLADISRIGGYGIEPSYVKAFSYYTRAIKVEEGGRGCFGLAMMHKLGQGVQKSKDSAKYYTEKAIKLLTENATNNRPYLIRLDELYRSGILIPADIKKADEYKAQLDALIAKRNK